MFVVVVYTVTLVKPTVVVGSPLYLLILFTLREERGERERERMFTLGWLGGGGTDLELSVAGLLVLRPSLVEMCVRQDASLDSRA